MQKKSPRKPPKAAEQHQPASAPAKHGRWLPAALPVFFVLTWLWAAWYYGSVFHISREYSFWSADVRLMEFILSQPTLFSNLKAFIAVSHLCPPFLEVISSVLDILIFVNCI